jgi:hypothetical protein
MEVWKYPRKNRAKITPFWYSHFLPHFHHHIWKFWGEKGGGDMTKQMFPLSSLFFAKISIFCPSVLPPLQNDPDRHLNNDICHALFSFGDLPPGTPLRCGVGRMLRVSR